MTRPGVPLALLVVTGTAVGEHHAQPALTAEHHGIAVDLDRQLAGRREDQRTRLVGTRLVGMLVAGGMAQQPGHGREQERGRLAGPGLRLASDVLAAQGRWQCQFLDRRAVGEVGLSQAAQQLFRQVEGVE
jgi:hypothetical protein